MRSSSRTLLACHRDTSWEWSLTESTMFFIHINKQIWTRLIFIYQLDEAQNVSGIQYLYRLKHKMASYTHRVMQNIRINFFINLYLLNIYKNILISPTKEKLAPHHILIGLSFISTIKSTGSIAKSMSPRYSFQFCISPLFGTVHVWYWARPVFYPSSFAFWQTRKIWYWAFNIRPSP